MSNNESKKEITAVIICHTGNKKKQSRALHCGIQYSAVWFGYILLNLSNVAGHQTMNSIVYIQYKQMNQNISQKQLNVKQFVTH